MRPNPILAVLAASLALAAPAAAQFGPPRLEDAPVVDELIVRAYGGPPWWKVSDKDTTVYILAGPGPVSPGVKVDTTLMEKRITGANEVIMPSELSFGLTAILAMPGINGLLKQMNGATRTDLEGKLPADLRARFVAGRTKFNQPAQRYGSLPIGLAGMALAGDAAVAAAPKGPREDLKGATYIGDEAIKIAKAKRVKVTRAKVYSGGAFNAFLTESKLPGLDCLRATLDEMEQAPSREGPSPAERRRVTSAWAEGDVRPLIREAQGEGGSASGLLNANFGKKGTVRILMHPVCLKSMPRVNRISDNWTAEEAAAIARALKKPGHAVAVLDAGSLLTQGGVLDILRKQGFTVKAPNVD